jgi:hypothetical protein
MTTDAATKQDNKKATTLAGWKKAKVHTVTLASGVEADIQIPNLPELVSSGEFPNHLVDVAISVAQRDTEDKITSDEIKSQAEFYRELVSRAVVSPALSPEDVKDIPFEDVELIVSIATRQRDVDALGHHIAGLDKNADWRKFRGLDYLD